MSNTPTKLIIAASFRRQLIFSLKKNTPPSIRKTGSDWLIEIALASVIFISDETHITVARASQKIRRAQYLF